MCVLNHFVLDRKSLLRGQRHKLVRELFDQALVDLILGLGICIDDGHKRKFLGMVFFDGLREYYPFAETTELNLS